MRLALLLILMAACSSVDPVDGAHDAATPPCDGGVEGPLGTCVEPDAGVPGCSSFGGPCTTAQACCDGAGLSCVAPGESTCGACRRVEDECGDEQPCTEGSLCVTVPPPACACEARDVRTCVLDCRTSGCADGERCDDSGRCLPLACEDGFACPAGMDCVGARGDAHGCVRRSCRSSGDCPDDARHCVNGACHPKAGVCEPPRP